MGESGNTAQPAAAQSLHPRLNVVETPEPRNQNSQ